MREALRPFPARAHAGEIERYFAGTLREPVEVLIAFDERAAAIGFIELSIRAYAEGCVTDRVAFVEGWYVEPMARGNGVGAALIRAAATHRETVKRSRTAKRVPSRVEGTPLFRPRCSVPLCESVTSVVSVASSGSRDGK